MEDEEEPQEQLEEEEAVPNTPCRKVRCKDQAAKQPRQTAQHRAVGETSKELRDGGRGRAKEGPGL